MARDIFDEIRRLEDELDGIFNSFWEEARIPRLSLSRGEGQKEIEPSRPVRLPRLGIWNPAVDVIEKENEIIVKCDLPGVDKNNVKIKVEEDSISIAGDVSKEKKEEGEDYYVEERFAGSFKRVIPLPAEVDPEKAQAKFENGVLEITLPKVEAGKKAKEITL